MIGAHTPRPRKDYGAPLRIYRNPCNGGEYFAALPPRSQRAAELYRHADGTWRAIFVPFFGLIPYVVQIGYANVRPGRHLGHRVHWGNLPSPVQRALRGSFLAAYCPREED